MKEKLENKETSGGTQTETLEKPAKEISRRKFLSVSGLAVGAAGATVAVSGGLGLLTNSLASAQTSPPTCATTPGTVKHPRGTWGYPSAGLDADACAERAYHGFFANACCWAVVDGVLGTLQEQLGSPYTNLDLTAFKFGGAGVNGWGTICGTALGAALCTNIIAGVEGTADRGSQMSNDLLAYYAATAMPVYVPVASEYASRGGTISSYLPGGTYPSSTANSPLCHVSTNKWMNAANLDPNKPAGYSIVSSTIERKDRCARLAGSMAKKTVELLNSWRAGSYTAGAWGGAGVGNPGGSPAQNNCTDCHTL